MYLRPSPSDHNVTAGIGPHTRFTTGAGFFSYDRCRRDLRQLASWESKSCPCQMVMGQVGMHFKKSNGRTIQLYVHDMAYVSWIFIDVTNLNFRTCWKNKARSLTQAHFCAQTS